MKLNTTKALIATVLATAFAGVSVTAIAQNSTPPVAPQVQPEVRGTPMDPARMAERQKLMQERMTERHARHMERLKADLKITAEQEAAWKAFVVRTEPTPRKTPAAPQDWSKLTTPQRLEAMQALHAERSAEMTKRIDATKSFYAQLTPEQQKAFDARGTGMHRAGYQGEHRMGGKSGHHGRHGGQHGTGDGMMGCDGPMGGMGGPGPRS